MKLQNIFAISLLALSAGCNLVSSEPVSIHAVTSDDEQHGGTYYLPKQLLQVTAELTGGAVTALTTAVVTVPDERQAFQVNFNLSPLADDNIQVDYKNGMLKQINATSVDRTADILINLAKDLALFRDGQPVGAKQTRFFQFDPYNFKEAKAVNAFLAKTGSCVEVELSPGIWSPGCGRSSLGQAIAGSGQEAYAVGQSKALSSVGVYYRRALPKTVHSVMGGETAELKKLLFANAGPVYRIAIKRSAFVSRETKISFEDGELTSVSVKKDSELLAASTLPVQIFDAYVGGIVDTFTQRKSVQNARAEYYNSQSERIKAEIALAKAQAQAGGNVADTPLSGSAISSGLLSGDSISTERQRCLDAHAIDRSQCL